MKGRKRLLRPKNEAKEDMYAMYAMVERMQWSSGDILGFECMESIASFVLNIQAKFIITIE